MANTIKADGITTFNIRASKGIYYQEDVDALQWLVTGDGSLMDRETIFYNIHKDTSVYPVFPDSDDDSYRSPSLTGLITELNNSLSIVPCISSNASRDINVINRVADMIEFNLERHYATLFTHVDNLGAFYITSNMFRVYDDKSKHLYVYFKNTGSGGIYDDCYTSTFEYDDGYGREESRGEKLFHYYKNEGDLDWSFTEEDFNNNLLYIGDNGFLKREAYIHDHLSRHNTMSFHKCYTPTVVIEEGVLSYGNFLDFVKNDSLVFVIPDRENIGIEFNIEIKNSIGENITSVKKGNFFFVHATTYYKDGTTPNPVPEANGKISVWKDYGNSHTIGIPTFFAGVEFTYILAVPTYDLDIEVDHAFGLSLSGSSNYVYKGDPYSIPGVPGTFLPLVKKFTLTITE